MKKLSKSKEKDPLGFLVVEPEHLKFKYRTTQNKKEGRPKNVQTKNERGNLEVFLAPATLPMQGEIQLIK